MRIRKSVQLVFAIAVLAVMAIGVYFVASRKYRDVDAFATLRELPAYDVRSLTRTTLVPTLNSPIPDSHN